MAGFNRSATICVAYLMKAEGWTLLRAVRHLKRMRGGAVLANEGFREQLVNMAEELNLCYDG